MKHLPALALKMDIAIIKKRCESKFIRNWKITIVSVEVGYTGQLSCENS
jgi:hypothetical protein